MYPVFLTTNLKRLNNSSEPPRLRGPPLRGCMETPGGGHPGGRVVVVWAVSGETVASVETEGQRSVKATC